MVSMYDIFLVGINNYIKYEDWFELIIKYMYD